MKFKIKLFCLLLVVSSAFMNARPYLVENYNATVNVTFRVDMSSVDTHAGGVYLAGGAFGQDGRLMTDDGNDVWSVTVSLNVNQRYLYKFRNQPSFGTWDGFEDQAGLIAGACGTGEYNDRFVQVAESDIVLDIVSYGSCTRDVAPVSGCMDSNAINYNADATIDNGLCSYPGPDTPAPTPTVDASKVISIYSDVYTSIYTDLSGSWSDSEHEEIQIGSDHMVKFIPAGAGHQKASIDISATNVSAMETLHLDYFATNSSTKLKFNFYSNGDTNFWEVATDGGGVVAGSWQSIDIPLSHFTNDLSNVKWFRIEAPSPADIVYMDNVYLYGGTVVNIPGCTDAAAENYNAEASQDDGSCTYNSTAYCSTQVTHFNIEAETPSAVLLTIENVDANTVEVSAISANDDPVDVLFIGAQSNPASVVGETSIVDGTASFRLTWNDGAPAVTSFEILWSKESMGGNWMLNRDQLSAINTADACPEEPAVIPGCTDATRCNYNSASTNDDGTCLPALDGICESCSGETDGTGTIVDHDADDDGVCDADEVEGCTDAARCNYNSAATNDDGTCLPALDGICESCSGETDGTGTIVDHDADDDGVCDADEVEGCTDATRCNYNSAATNDDGTCLPALDGICESCSGETDGTGTIVDHDADDDGICDIDEVHIVEFTDVKMEIYPNPVTDQLHLIMNDNFNRLNIEVVNPLGVSLIHKEMKDIALGSVMEFDIDHLPKGMYVLKVSTHRERITTIPWMKQ